MTTNLPSALDQLLNKQVQGNGVQAITRPAANFIGSGVSVVDNPGNNSTDITINSGGAFGKVNLTLANGTNSNKATDGSLLQVIGGPTAAFALGSVLPSVSLVSGQPVVFTNSTMQPWSMVHLDPSATGSSLKFSIPGQSVAGATVVVFGKVSVHFDGTNLVADLGTNYRRFFNVRELGATGNGSHDDTSVINAALTAAATASLVTGAVRVYIPAGTYKISAPLVLPNAFGVIIEGDGQLQTVLNPTNGLAGQQGIFIFENCQYCELRDSTINVSGSVPVGGSLTGNVVAGATSISVSAVPSQAVAEATLVVYRAAPTVELIEIATVTTTSTGVINFSPALAGTYTTANVDKWAIIPTSAVLNLNNRAAPGRIQDNNANRCRNVRVDCGSQNYYVGAAFMTYPTAGVGSSDDNDNAQHKFTECTTLGAFRGFSFNGNNSENNIVDDSQTTACWGTYNNGGSFNATGQNAWGTQYGIHDFTGTSTNPSSAVGGYSEGYGVLLRVLGASNLQISFMAPQYSQSTSVTMSGVNSSGQPTVNVGAHTAIMFVPGQSANLASQSAATNERLIVKSIGEGGSSVTFTTNLAHTYANGDVVIADPISISGTNTRCAVHDGDLALGNSTGGQVSVVETGASWSYLDLYGVKLGVCGAIASQAFVRDFGSSWTATSDGTPRETTTSSGQIVHFGGGTANSNGGSPYLITQLRGILSLLLASGKNLANDDGTGNTVLGDLANTTTTIEGGGGYIGISSVINCSVPVELQAGIEGAGAPLFYLKSAPALATTGNTTLSTAQIQTPYCQPAAVSLTGNVSVTYPAAAQQTGARFLFDAKNITFNGHTVSLIINGNTWGTPITAAGVWELTFDGTKFLGSSENGMTDEDNTALRREMTELSSQVGDLAKIVERHIEGQKLEATRHAEIVARIDSYAEDVRIAMASFDALRIEWMRRTLNGLADTESPPASGPDEDTNPGRPRRPQ